MDENNILAVTVQKVRFARKRESFLRITCLTESCMKSETARIPPKGHNRACPIWTFRHDEAKLHWRLRWCQSCAASQSQIVLDQSRILWIASLFEVGFLPEGTMVLRHSQQVLQWDFLVDLIRTNCGCVGRISGYEMWLDPTKTEIGPWRNSDRSKSNFPKCSVLRTDNKPVISLKRYDRSVGKWCNFTSRDRIAASRSFYYSLTGTHGTAVRCSAISSPRSEASFIPLCRIGYF